MRLGPQVYVDLKSDTSALARYINDCRNSSLYNVRFEKLPEEGKALVVATRQISAGEELFVDYGKWYWAGAGIKATKLPINVARDILLSIQSLSSA